MRHRGVHRVDVDLTEQQEREAEARKTLIAALEDLAEEADQLVRLLGRRGGDRVGLERLDKVRAAYGRVRNADEYLDQRQYDLRTAAGEQD